MATTNNRIKYVNRKTFITELNKMKMQNNISTSKIAKNSGLSMSYAYHIVSQKEQRPVTLVAARQFGKGLQLNSQQADEWNRKVLDTTKHDDFFQPATVHIHSNKKPELSLSRVVKEIMDKKGLNSLTVADNAGLDMKHVNKFLSGSLQLSKIDEARLARGLGSDYKHLEALRKKPAASHEGAKSAQQKPSKKIPTVHQKKQSQPKQSTNVTQSVKSQDTASLRPDVLALAKRINTLCLTDTDIVRLVTDRLMNRK